MLYIIFLHQKMPILMFSREKNDIYHFSHRKMLILMFSGEKNVVYHFSLLEMLISCFLKGNTLRKMGFPIRSINQRFPKRNMLIFAFPDQKCQFNVFQREKCYTSFFSIRNVNFTFSKEKHVKKNRFPNQKL